MLFMQKKHVPGPRDTCKARSVGEYLRRVRTRVLDSAAQLCIWNRDTGTNNGGFSLVALASSASVYDVHAVNQLVHDLAACSPCPCYLHSSPIKHSEQRTKIAKQITAILGVPSPKHGSPVSMNILHPFLQTITSK
jgi:hypothetical protein